MKRLVITTLHGVIIRSLGQDSHLRPPVPQHENIFLNGLLQPLKAFLQRAAREYLEHALIQTSWNICKTAEQLGIHHSGFYRKIEAYNLVNKNSSHDNFSL